MTISSDLDVEHSCSHQEWFRLGSTITLLSFSGVTIFKFSGYSRPLGFKIRRLTRCTGQRAVRAPRITTLHGAPTYLSVNKGSYYVPPPRAAGSAWRTSRRVRCHACITQWEMVETSMSIQRRLDAMDVYSTSIASKRRRIDIEILAISHWVARGRTIHTF